MRGHRDRGALQLGPALPTTRAALTALDVDLTERHCSGEQGMLLGDGLVEYEGLQELSYRRLYRGLGRDRPAFSDASAHSPGPTPNEPAQGAEEKGRFDPDRSDRLEQTRRRASAGTYESEEVRASKRSWLLAAYTLLSMEASVFNGRLSTSKTAKCPG